VLHAPPPLNPQFNHPNHERCDFILKKSFIFAIISVNKELYDRLSRRNNKWLQTFAVKVSWKVASWGELVGDVGRDGHGTKPYKRF
jgi:hypothetical protein